MEALASSSLQGLYMSTTISRQSYNITMMFDNSWLRRI